MTPGAGPAPAGMAGTGPGGASPPSVGVVIATRDRRRDLLGTLARLTALPERPPVVVVDNGSTDGTPMAVRSAHADVDLVALGRNLGGAARTVGARRLGTPLVAFADDDSWWAPGALAEAARVFAAHPRLGLLAARVLVGEEERLDPVCHAMRESPLPAHDGLPGPPVLGFVACGAIVRRKAFLAAGGFHERFGIGGEEELLAADLAAAGWDLAYIDRVVAHHHPAGATGPRPGRRRRQVRNALWFSWLRRPLPVALRATAGALRAGHVRAVAAAASGLPWVVRQRRPVPDGVEQALRTLQAA